MDRVLVTGANGFLGSWLTRRLCAEGLAVRILCRKQSDLSDLNGLLFETQYGDVTDKASLIKALDGVKHVFHAAAVIGYKRSDRRLMEHVNVTGTENVLTAILHSRVETLTYVSSVVAVGASFDGTRPLCESDPYNMGAYNFGYFETKRKAEEAVVQFARTSGRRTIIVNPSTVYGPGDAKKGSRGVQLKVARGKFPYYTSGGVSVVHVEDVIDGIWSAFQKGLTGERYILSGDNIAIKELFTKISGYAGVKPPGVYLPNPIVRLIGKTCDQLEALGLKAPLNSESALNSILFHWFDHTKASRQLGFKPRPADEAIHDSVAWMKKRALIV